MSCRAEHPKPERDASRLRGGPCLVAGVGRAGRAAVEALLRIPSVERVIAWDGSAGGAARSTARGLRRRGVEVLLGGDGIAALDAAGPAATIVKSPGIDPRSPLFRCARERGLDVLDELELGWLLSRSRIVGVTGTNGKSTTAQLISMVLAAAGTPAQLVGNTQFGPPLSAAAEGEWVVCEVSSFQLEACPSFLPDVAVFTNLTLEHLARHADMRNYGDAKRRMFIRGNRAAGTAIVNIDDPFGRRLAAEVAERGGRVVSYGFGADADVRIEKTVWDMHEGWHSLCTPDGEIHCATGLPGRHNASNIAAAVALGHSLGLPARSVGEALRGVSGPPGRWDVVDGAHSFDVVVDFAHNPDGIRQLLETARAVTDRRDGAALRAVLGATGRHEREKALQMGRFARALSDHLILTTGTVTYDPRIVRLNELRDAAEDGEGELEIVLDRRAAIERAIAAARPGDVVVLLGLGALTDLVLDSAGTTCPFSDRQVAHETLARLPEPLAHPEPAWS